MMKKRRELNSILRLILVITSIIKRINCECRVEDARSLNKGKCSIGIFYHPGIRFDKVTKTQ